MSDTKVPKIARRGNPGPFGPSSPAPGAASPASAADRRPSLRYEALRFPGCRRIPLTRDELERSDDRIEYWDARAETA